MEGVACDLTIEELLAKYRLGKQKKELVTLADKDDMLSMPRDDTKSLIKFLHKGFSYFGLFRMKMSDALFSAVAPDHIQIASDDEEDSLRQMGGIPVGTADCNDAQVPLLPPADCSDAQVSLLPPGYCSDAQVPLLPTADASDSDDAEDSERTGQPSPGILARIIRRRSGLDWIMLGLKVALWFLLWEIFIIWQFGAVYFLLSGFFFIGYNLRSGPKVSGEVSAYSVFNKDLRRIDGTVSAEQLQREMLFRF